MPRIRSIRPEFWTDPRVLKLTPTEACFYIAMWNHMDDQGKIPYDFAMFKAIFPIGKRMNIYNIVHTLLLHRLLEVDTSSCWCRSTVWHMQRQSKPIVPIVDSNNLQWLTQHDPHSRVEKSRSRVEELRKGEVRKEPKERSRKKESPSVSALATQEPPVKDTLKENTRGVIAYYCESWKKRYNANPPIGGKESGIIKRLVSDFGPRRTCELLRCYLGMDDAFFLTKRHDLATFSLNLNSIVAKLDGGITISRKNAQLAEEAATPTVSKMDLEWERMKEKLAELKKGEANANSELVGIGCDSENGSVHELEAGSCEEDSSGLE